MFSRDEPIYWSKQSIKVLTKCSYIPHASRQLVQESSQGSYLVAMLAGAFSQTSRQDEP